MRRADRRQLSSPSRASRRSSASENEPKSQLETVSKLLQILAVLAAGGWTLNEYVEFKKQNNELTIEQQKLSNETAKLTQKSIELNNETAKLAARGAELNNRLAEFNVKKLDEHNVSLDGKIDVLQLRDLADGTKLYKVTTTYFAKNVSDQWVMLQENVLHSFVGSVSLANLAPDDLIEVRGPEEKGSASGGRIRWRTTGDTLRVDENVPPERRSKDVAKWGNPVSDDLLIGRLGPGRVAWLSSDFLIVGKPEELVGFKFVMFWVPDNERTAEPEFTFRSEWVFLSDAKKQADVPNAPTSEPKSNLSSAAP